MIVPEKRYLSNGGDKISKESLKFTMQWMHLHPNCALKEEN